MNRAESLVRDILHLADVEVNGTRPWDIKVHDQQLYHRLLSKGVLGLGESYMDGWWDCEDLGELIFKVLNADLEHRISPLSLLLPVFKSMIVNMQRKSKAARDVGSHYNLGNVLFQNMLDKRMTYSCGYWRDVDSLDAAQEAKLDLICKKLGLQSGSRLLDIGCGWGSLIKYAAERYGVQAVGITLSKDQVELGTELCKGLPVEIRLQDYRDLDEKFDHIASVGMFEHVGVKNHKTFMNVVSRNLIDDGLFLLHTIGTNTAKDSSDPWTQKYIFPGSMLPTVEQTAKASQDVLVVEDWQNFGVDYATTLLAWHDNFTKNWKTKISSQYDQRFYRMWTYFLKTTSGAFRARRNQLWQIVFSKTGVPGGYRGIR